MTETDTEAPYGRHPDGTPKRSNGGRKPGSATRNRRAASAPKKASTPPRKAPAAGTGPANKPADYTAAATEVATLIGISVAVTSPLDGAVFMSCADELGAAVNDMAQINAHVRKACEKFQTIGPYGRFGQLCLKIGAQIFENHQWLPLIVTKPFGAVPREHFAHQFQEKAYAMAAAQESAVPYPADSDAPTMPDNVAPFERRDSVHV